MAGVGVDLVYEERGGGPAVLLIHDMAGDHVSALQGAGALADVARVIGYSRRGYGGSGVPEPYSGTTVHEQAEDAAAVLRALAPAGAVVVGEGFGALIALDLLLRHGELVRKAVLLDTPLLAFVADATRELADERGRMEQALRDGGPAAGIDAWLEGRPGSGHRERAHDSPQAFFADYAGLASWPVTRRELRSIRQPVVVLTSERSPRHIVAAADALAALLPLSVRCDDGDLVGSARSLLATG